MADSVQYHLEKMLPELEDLEKRGIFSKNEIKSIVKKRTDLEYSVHKKIARKRDFINYIEYEINLDRLRKKRKQRLGLNKKPENGQKGMSISDHSLTQRIHGLYGKALKKFCGDVDLWIQYFEWCKMAKSSKALGSQFARAIQFHPTKAVFWILAAAWEFEDNGNMTSARVLLQRGLRINPDNQQLWIEYFKLEMLWIEKIKERRKILFKKELESNDIEPTGEDQIDLPEMDIEKSLGDSAAFEIGDMAVNGELSAMQSALLGLVIPKAVFNNAIKAIPENLDFRIKFLDIYQQFGKDATSGMDAVYDSISNDFSDSARAKSILAERYIAGISPLDPAFPMQLKLSVNEYENLVQTMKTSEICALYAKFLICNSEKCKEPNLVKYFYIILMQLYKKAELMEIMSSQMYLDWLDQSENDSRMIERALERFPEDEKLWLKKLGNTQESELVHLYEEALKWVKGTSSFHIWTNYLDHLIKKCKNELKSPNTIDDEDFESPDLNSNDIFIEDVERKFEECLSKKSIESTPLEILIAQKYLEWIFSTSGIVRVRKVTESLTCLKLRSPEFYKICIMLEQKVDITGITNINLKHIEICKLYELALTSDVCDMNTWLSYIEYSLVEMKDATKASQLCWKATKEVKNQDEFLLEKKKSISEIDRKRLRGALIKSKIKSNDDNDCSIEIKSCSKSISQVKETKSLLTPLQLKMQKKLTGAQFRWINEQLYTNDSQKAVEIFKEKPEIFEIYHQGFRLQVLDWPTNPVDVFIKQLSTKDSNTIVADMGCGDAKIAKTLHQKIKIHSFDLASPNPHVTACDIAHVPLPPKSVDIVIFCLSLMGTNYIDFIIEAHRILKKGGELKIAEVTSRLSNIDIFIESLLSIGFKLQNKDSTNKMFVLLYFKKYGRLSDTLSEQQKSLLKPCVYKKR